MADEDTLEAVCWFECGSHDALMAVREWWDVRWDRTSAEPDPERTKIICHWPDPKDEEGNAWLRTWSYGIDQAAWFVEDCPVEGVYLFAVHIQPLDAEYPQTLQHAYISGAA